jgi:hypothetical protein
MLIFGISTSGKVLRVMTAVSFDITGGYDAIRRETVSLCTIPLPEAGRSESYPR